ncbi:MAG: flagellar biosynthetic protein FliR [Planctomycetota bacterium]
MGDLEYELRFFFLHWVRCIALLAPVPLFGQGGGARLTKLGLGVMIGSLVALGRSRENFADPGFSGQIVVAMLGEIMLGYLMGFVVNLTFETIRVAGTLISTEMGFNLASIQDPVSGVNVQVIAHILESFGIVLFFSVGGHLFVIRGLVSSFDRYEVGRFALGPELIQAVVLFTSGLFGAAFELAAPILVAMIVGGIALGIIARVAPQLQVMQFAFSFKIVIGLLLIVSTLHLVVPAMGLVFHRTETMLAEMTAS